MQRTIFLIILLVLVSFDKPKLKRVKVAEGISVALPKDWQPMDDLDFTERYPSVRAPVAAYTNEDRAVDFSVNISATQWPDADIDLARQFFKSAVLNTFDKVEMIHEGIHDLRGKKFIFFEFESYIKGDSKNEGLRSPVREYTYLEYLVQPGRTLVFSFHIPIRLRAEWQETAEEIMTSVRVK